MTPHLLTVLVACFAMMETPNGVPSRPGPAGETGRWQLTPAVRRDRTKELKKLLRPGRITDEAIATQQVIWIRQQLIKHGFNNPTTIEIAVSWNAGVHATLSGTAPKRAYDYAARFELLLDEFIKNIK